VQKQSQTTYTKQQLVLIIPGNQQARVTMN
jgi:hypothetical protein